MDEAEVTQELIDQLAQTAFTMMGALNRLASDHDLSLTQLRVLAILRDRRLRMSELVGHLGVEKSSLTGLVTRAQARGLVQRVPSETDGRAVDVLLTEQGELLADQLGRELARRLAPMTGRLPVREQRRLRDLLAGVLGFES